MTLLATALRGLCFGCHASSDSRLLGIYHVPLVHQVSEPVGHVAGL